MVIKPKRGWWEWSQIIITTILVPLILGAWKWAGDMETRITENNTAIRLVQKDITTGSKSDDALNVQIDKLLSKTQEILQRVSSIEAKLPR